MKRNCQVFLIDDGFMNPNNLNKSRPTTRNFRWEWMQNRPPPPKKKKKDFGGKSKSFGPAYSLQNPNFYPFKRTKLNKTIWYARLCTNKCTMNIMKNATTIHVCHLLKIALHSTLSTMHVCYLLKNTFHHSLSTACRTIFSR